MKRVISWVKEEKITLMILLMGIGIILENMHILKMFAGFLIYGVVIIAVLNAAHSLYNKLKH